MIPTKVYILRIDTEISKAYAKTCSDSCDAIGMKWEYFDWHHEIDANDAWNTIGFKRKFNHNHHSNKAQLATSGHAAIWKRISDNKECAIILEHDAIMLHKIDIDIPNNQLVVLGYKMTDPFRYDHITAGGPTKITPINCHEGAHAYAINHITADTLIEELELRGIRGAIDNIYFLKRRDTVVPLFIMEPTPAIGWLRESTIWNKASTRNMAFINTFDKYYNKPIARPAPIPRNRLNYK